MEGQSARQALIEQLFQVVDRARTTYGVYTRTHAEQHVDAMLETLLEMAGGPCIIDEKALNGIAEAGREVFASGRASTGYPLLGVHALALYMERSGYRPNFRIQLRGGK
jgi:hypothetical protein